MPVIPALGKLRQEDQCEFETSLGYTSELKASLSCIVRPCLKKKKIKIKIKIKIKHNQGRWDGSVV